MTRQKHLKQRVRARMRKTGESYVTARRHVVARLPDEPPAALRAAAAPEIATSPSPRRATTTKAAGIGGEALRKATGRDWEEWFAVLDRAGAQRLDHRGIAARLAGEGVGPWWRQMIAVGYEQARGLRAIHQRRDGSFQASASKTLAGPLSAAWEAWSGRGRHAWLVAPGPITVRKTTPPRAVAKPTTPAASLRLGWSDGGLVQVYFYAKANGRCSISVQREKLPDAKAVADFKALWKDNLERLARALAAR